MFELEIDFDFGINERQRKAFLAGLFLCGNLSFFTIANQSLPLKILRLSLITAGSIAGGILLKEHRTPSRLENEILTFEQQKEQEIRAIAQQREELYRENELLDQQLQNWANEQAQSWQEQYQDQQQLYEGTIVELQSRISQLEGIKRPKGTSRVQWVANQILDVFLEYEVLCDYKDCLAVPGEDRFWFEPRYGVKTKQLKDIAEEIRVRVPGIEATPEIAVVEGAVEVVCRVHATRVAKQKEADRTKLITEPDYDWFKMAIQKSNHYFVNGDTGAGKSTLVNNICCLALEELGEGTEVIIIDPKYPDTPWMIAGKEFEPQYTGQDEALQGLQDMEQEVLDRLESAREAKKNKRKPPKRTPILYVIDEGENLIATFGKQASEPILATTRVGRSTGVKVVLLGQSPMCSDYGMKKANLNNSTRIYMRENAMKGADDTCTTTSQKKAILSQIEARQEASVEDSNKQFYGLIKFPGKPAFLAQFPKPNQYAFGNYEPFIDEEEIPLERVEDLPVEDLVDLAMQEDGWL
jgi:energy-coupling factor transporter ATP-binding protein EcfA2